VEIELTQEDQARIRDSSHSIQAASESLRDMDPRKIANLARIRNCLRDADYALRSALYNFRQGVKNK
jgi:hypothetical protein